MFLVREDRCNNRQELEEVSLKDVIAGGKDIQVRMGVLEVERIGGERGRGILETPGREWKITDHGFSLSTIQEQD